MAKDQTYPIELCRCYHDPESIMKYVARIPVYSPNESVDGKYEGVSGEHVTRPRIIMGSLRQCPFCKRIEVLRENTTGS